MIKLRDIILLFSVITLSGFIHYKVNKQKKEISFLLNENNKIQEIVDLKEINWTYLKRPENLIYINEKFFKLEPIILEDIIYLHK